jgi:hypothetical protein
MSKLLRFVSKHLQVRAKAQNASAYLARSTQAAVETGDFVCRPHSIISIKLRRIVEPTCDAHGKVNRDSHPNSCYSTQALASTQRSIGPN